MTFPPDLGARVAGRYELKSRLRGSGACWTVVARDRHTGRDVGLMLVEPQRCEAASWEAFARIVRLAGSSGASGLALPQDVPAVAPDPPHCVVDPSRGLDHVREREGNWPWQRALALGERVAEILQTAHAGLGVAHRALLPSRCVLTERGEVLVLDYGVAEFEPAGGRADDAGYRAPEQELGRGDALSDVYSLAAIVFELISGKRPSTKTPARLRSILPGIPREVDELFARALSRDPSRRPAAMAAFRGAMREALGLPPAVVVSPLSPPDDASAPSVVKPSIDAQAGRTAGEAGEMRVLGAPDATEFFHVSRRVEAEPSRLTDQTEVLPSSTPTRAAFEPSTALSPLADRTEVLPRSTPIRTSFEPSTAPASLEDRTEVLSRPAPAQAPMVCPSTSLEERTEVLPRSSSARAPAERTELLADLRSMKASTEPSSRSVISEFTGFDTDADDRTTRAKPRRVSKEPAGFGLQRASASVANASEVPRAERATVEPDERAPEGPRPVERPWLMHGSDRPVVIGLVLATLTILGLIMIAW